jgi:hypothetical protein
MRSLVLMLFAVTGGLTLSGIVANAYRLLARQPKSRVATCAHCAVMVVAGPSVLFENATRSFRKKDCSTAAYGFAVAIAAYWSFMLGLALIETSSII